MNRQTKWKINKWVGRVEVKARSCLWTWKALEQDFSSYSARFLSSWPPECGVLSAGGKLRGVLVALHIGLLLCQGAIALGHGVLRNSEFSPKLIRPSDYNIFLFISIPLTTGHTTGGWSTVVRFPALLLPRTSRLILGSTQILMWFGNKFHPLG